MNLKTTIFLLFICLAFHQPIQAQTDDTPKKKQHIEANKIWNLDVLGAIDFPAADMAKRFGTSYRIGVGIKLKTSSNWILGAKFEFIVGKKMKEDSLLYNMKNELGIISQSGEVFNVGMFERGYMAGIQFGKIFPFAQLNVNSGPMMLASVGFIQYKINFFDRNNSFPQLRDEYKKGYDRLTNGVYIEDFIGYNYHSRNKLINFYAGANFVWGFTKVRRDYIIDLARTDNSNRNDILVGFKLGWVVPIYRKKTEDTYY